jgi:hypothetical protein
MTTNTIDYAVDGLKTEKWNGNGRFRERIDAHATWT